MEKKSQSSWIGISPYAKEAEISSSIVATTENLDEISNKINQMLPDMKCIQGTGIIKKTESFKESKEILTNFRTALYHLSEEAIQNSNPLQSYGITDKEVIQIKNKNAYEIRLSILQEAIDWCKLHPDENVLDTAAKFYKFVENKR